jgi:hypothetical protein
MIDVGAKETIAFVGGAKVAILVVVGMGIGGGIIGPEEIVANVGENVGEKVVTFPEFTGGVYLTGV